MANELYEKRGYLLEDFRLFHLRAAQGVKTEYHYHEFCKLLLLVSGSGGYWVEGRRYALQPGDVVLLGSRCVHKPDFAPNSPYERIILYIDPEFLRQASTADCDLLALFSGVESHVLRPQNGGKQLHNLALALEKALAGPEYGRVILSTGMLLRLLVEIGRARNCGSAQLPAPLQPQNERIQQLLRYIDRHICEDLTIEQLSDSFYLSKYHLMRLFRAETGQSIYGYITQQRLILAREQIRQGMRATEAAFRSGFGSYSSFTRAYSKYFGTTPTGRAIGPTDDTFE